MSYLPLFSLLELLEYVKLLIFFFFLKKISINNSSFIISTYINHHLQCIYIQLRLLLLNQYLIVFLVFLIYYAIYCIYTVFAAFTIPSYIKGLEDKAKQYAGRSILTVQQLNSRLNYIRIFLMIHTFIPFFVYVSDVFIDKIFI